MIATKPEQQKAMMSKNNMPGGRASADDDHVAPRNEVDDQAASASSGAEVARSGMSGIQPGVEEVSEGGHRGMESAVGFSVAYSGGIASRGNHVQLQPHPADATGATSSTGITTKASPRKGPKGAAKVKARTKPEGMPKRPLR